MAQQRSTAVGTASPVMIAVGSLVILFHFGAILLHVLAAPSGPWPGPDGLMMANAPAFTESLDESLVKGYLKPLKLTHNYHFAGNHPTAPGVFLEVKLKDAKGELLTTCRFPDASTNSWVRHLQALFAQGLVPDQPIAPPQGEEIPAPHQQVRTVSIWDFVADQSLRVSHVAEHLVPRNRPVYAPTEWSLVLAHSYARYLCRTHGAASAEVIRHSRESISPTMFLTGDPPSMAFTDLIANYGDISGE